MSSNRNMAENNVIRKSTTRLPISIPPQDALPPIQNPTRMQRPRLSSVSVKPTIVSDSNGGGQSSGGNGAQSQGLASSGEKSMESELTNEKLHKLEKMFEEADEDCGGGLDMDEFRQAMRQTMGAQVSDEEMDMIFMKVDTNCDGTVDWDEYLTYMLLECREKDQMQQQAQQPFPREMRLIRWGNRDCIIRLRYLPNVKTLERNGTRRTYLDEKHGRYVVASKDGTVTFWAHDFSSHVIKIVEPLPPHKRSVWVTDMVVMPRANILAVSTTSRDIVFYDITKGRFERLSRISRLPACPTTMCYWTDRLSTSKPLLVWGDDKGNICAVSFDMCPMVTPINPRRVKGCKEILEFEEVRRGKVQSLHGFYLPSVHNDTVRQVMYSDHLTCILSCSKDTDTALFVGNLERKIFSSLFRVEKGINAFDFCHKLNVIVTGGYDSIVRVWNPYVRAKPVILLLGHQSPVDHVMINSKKEHVISIAKNREIRVHDLTTQTCIQTLYRKMLPKMGPREITAALFNLPRQALLIASTTVAVLQRDEGHDSLVQSHIHPVTVVLYNQLFHQVVSASVDSLVCVWSVYTGEKVMQFKAHTYYCNGQVVEVEVTAMTFDPTYRRLITAARDGTVKVWNFNNGSCLRELPVIGSSEITAVICPKQFILTCGWDKRVTVYVDDVDDDTVTSLKPSHQHDILSMAHYPPNLVATASYGGDILVWSLETQRIVFCTNTHSSGRSMSLAVLGRLNHLNEQPDNEMTSDSAGRAREKPANMSQEGSTPGPTVTKRDCVEKLVFLPCRANVAGTATLFGACADGRVRAWSVHPRGGLLGTFLASYSPEFSLTTMTTTADNTLLIVGDDGGYIRVWDIGHYCKDGVVCSPAVDSERQSLWDKFPFYLFRKQGSGNVSLPSSRRMSMCLDEGEGVLHGPHLLNSFQAHLTSVGTIDFAHVMQTDVLISSASDGCVRMWTIYGEFLGLFGHPTLWRNIRKMDQDGGNMHSHLLPADVMRVASATTLFVLNGNVGAKWLLAKNVFSWVNPYNFHTIKKAPPKLLSVKPIEVIKETEETVSLPNLEATKTTCDSKILGSAYRKKNNHRPLPVLPKSISYHPQCAAFNSLPYAEVTNNRLDQICDMPALKRIQRFYRLPPLVATDSYKRFQATFRKVGIVSLFATHTPKESGPPIFAIRLPAEERANPAATKSTKASGQAGQSAGAREAVSNSKRRKSLFLPKDIALADTASSSSKSNLQPTGSLESNAAISIGKLHPISEQ